MTALKSFSLENMASIAFRKRDPLTVGWTKKELTGWLTLKVLLYRPHVKCLIILVSLTSAFLGLVAPYCQKLFLDTLLGHTSLAMTTSVTSEFGHLSLLITAAFLAMLLSQSMALLLRLLCAREGSITHEELGRALYIHALQLTGTVRSRRTVGDTVTYYTQDIAAAIALIEEFLPSLLNSFIPFIVAPLAISSYFSIPLSEISGILVFTCVLLLVMSYHQSKYFGKFKRLAGERLAIVNEWLQNMRMIRILGWTRAFESKIFSKREEETGNRLKMVTNGSVMNSIAQVAPLIINVAGVAVLIRHRHENVSPGDIFALLWIFGVFMARPLRTLPWTCVMFLDGNTSCQRLQSFFKNSIEPDPSTFPSAVNKTKLPEQHVVGPALEVKNLNLSMGGNNILRSIDLSIAPGEFVAIIGEVGSGKTQLFLSLLRDSPATFDKYMIGGQDVHTHQLMDARHWYAYVPQDGFIMSSSIRDNVAFSYEYPPSDDTFIGNSLRLAEFDVKTEHMHLGLDTEIGERGVNLSGGQRQRVGLARAHFHGRSFILLDDCLSAVDVDTERKLIANLICGAWGSATRLLVTHRLSILKYADRVLMMENGQLRKWDGTTKIS